MRRPPSRDPTPAHYRTASLLRETPAAVVLAAVELARRLALADFPERHPLDRPAEVAWTGDGSAISSIFRRDATGTGRERIEVEL